MADRYDTMTRDRPYRRPLLRDMAMKEVRRCAGDRLDTEAVEVFEKAYEFGEV
ncbi:MAG: hypothetical protein ACUVWO_05865 [Thermodesulfobacteriota bacterium]